MDTVDKAILNLIQISFPVHPRPYSIIGLETGISENEAFQRIEKLKKDKIIRRLGGIFESRNLGYVSTLCAAKVPEEKIPVLAELMQGITEITHNYLRNHLYNMWFTVIACSPERLEQILLKIRTALDSDQVYSLPASKIFKIEVRLDLLQDRKDDEVEEADGETEEETYGETAKKENTKKAINTDVITEEEKPLIRLLQGNLPHSLTPFSDLAEVLNKEEEEVLAMIRNFLQRGMLRRVVAILYHQKAGFTSNAMGAWNVPEELVNEVGNKMAEFKDVSHCYQRPSLPGFAYNLFTMIHGRSDEECREIAARMSTEIGIKDYTMLFSQRELKKSSMQYFAEKDI